MDEFRAWDGADLNRRMSAGCLDANRTEMEERGGDAADFDRDVLDLLESCLRDAAVEDTALIGVDDARVRHDERGPIPEPDGSERHVHPKDDEKNEQRRAEPPAREERHDEEEREEQAEERERDGACVREHGPADDRNDTLILSKVESFGESHSGNVTPTNLRMDSNLRIAAAPNW